MRKTSQKSPDIRSANQGENGAADVDQKAEPVPEILSQGTYAVYRTADEGAHLVYRPRGADADVHQRIPPMVFKLVTGQTKMPPMLERMLGKTLRES